MKKTILGISLLTTLLLTVGCGGDKKKVGFDDVKVEYKSGGTYDLSHYLVPAQNQISNYVKKVYTNKSGKRKYDNTPDEGNTTYSKTEYDINGTLIQAITDGALETTFKILTDKVTATDAKNKSVENYARYADKGDYILKEELTDAEDGTLKYFCKVADHLENTNINGHTYDDVLKVTCPMEIYDSATIAGNKVEVVGDGESILLFAKDKGMISFITDMCVENKFNGKKTESNCIKETQEITTIN